MACYANIRSNMAKKGSSGRMLIEEESMRLEGDRQSCISITKNPVFHGCVKHIEWPGT